MNTSLSPRRVHRPHKLRARPPTRGIPFKVFIGYSNLAAVRDATATIADAIRSSGRKFEIQPLLWRFDQLGSAHWRDRAIHAAREADVVVLASSEPADMTEGIEGWVTAFLSTNRGHRTTIVAIAGPSDAWTISIEEPAAQISSAAGVQQNPAAALLELAESRA